MNKFPIAELDHTWCRISAMAGILLLMIVCFPVVSYSGGLDSLKARLQEDLSDTARGKTLNELALKSVYSEPEKAKGYAEQALSLGKGAGQKKMMAKSHHAIGLYYYLQGDLSKCLEHWKKALSLRKEAGARKGVIATRGNIGVLYQRQSEYSKALNQYRTALEEAKELGAKKLMANNHGNIGVVYAKQGHYPKALEHYYDALKIGEELNDKKLMADNRGNIGNINQEQGNYEKAIKNYQRSLDLAEELNNKSLIGNALVNIGEVHKERRELSKALEHYFRSLRVRKELGDRKGIANTLGNIGTLYFLGYERGKGVSEEGERDSLRLVGRGGERIPYEELLDSALAFQKRAFDMRKSIGDRRGLTFSLNALGKIHMRKGRTDKALQFFRRSYSISTDIGALTRKMKTSKQLYQVFKRSDLADSSLLWLERYTAYKDSVFNKEKQKALGKQEARYKFEKKLLEQRKEQEKQAALARERNRRQRIIIYAGAGGLLLTLAFAFVVVNRLRVTRQQKRLIEEQKGLVEEKNREITDSINYAKRLQEAILPPQDLLDEHLKEYFILFKPKELVSGDFYFMDVLEENGKKLVYYSAADCTGHGVPGAMVSMVGANGLNRCIREFGLRDPGSILEKLSELVAEHFFQSEERIRDGMDLALCCLEEKDGRFQKVHFSGANNPLWLINPERDSWPEEGMAFRQGGGVEIPATRKSIGYTEEPVPFASHVIELEQGDSLYTFSDGFPDQFGGEKGKKFKTANFKSLFLSIQNKGMEEQKTYIDRTLEEWKGDLEQVDDICVVGVRV